MLTASVAANWTGGGTDTKWSTPENWSPEAVPTSGEVRFWEPKDFVSPFKDLDEKVVLFDDAYNLSSMMYVRKVGTADNPLVFEATSSANGLNAGGGWKIGYNNNEPGYLRLKSGTWSTGSGYLMQLGANSSTAWGELAVTDGAILTLGGNLNVLRGKVTLENASLTVDNKYNVNFGQHNGHDSVFELKAGGVFTAPFVRQYDGNRSSGGGTFLFNGGVLKANNADVSEFIQNSAYLTVKVGAGGGTIDANGNNISIKRPIEPDGADGGMKFIGGSTITFDAAPTYTGGTTVELGTKLVASDSAAKTAILDNGLVVDGRLKLASDAFDLFECSGLDPADLDKITFVNCGEGTEAVFDDEDSPTKIVVNFLVPACVGDSPVKVWSGKTLDEIAYGCTFTARFAGVSNKDTYYVPNSSTGYYEKVLRDDGGSVTNIIVEFQRQMENNVRCVVVSFEKGEDGIYATGLGARWIANKTVGNYEFYRADGWHGNEIDLAATPTANYYTVFDLRVDTLSTKVWTLDSDNTKWSTLRGDETLSSDTVVVIKVTGDYTLVVDENVNVGKIVFVDGTGSTLSVASGNALTTESVSGIGNILNAGTLVKTGDGTATMPFDNASTGVTIVNAGTLKVASVTGTGTAHTVCVKSGATFDLNCVWQTAVAVVLEGGANFANTGSSDAAWGSSINIRSLTLEGDATVTATRTFGLRTSGHGENTLNLGTHTLTVNASGKDFILDNTTINGTGKIVVASGRLASYSGSHGDNYTLEVRSGASLLGGGGGITCCNFVNNGTVTETVKVKGVLTTGNAIPNLTLIDGATVKATGVAQTVSSTFTADGTVTIDAEAITREQLNTAEMQRIPVLTVPTTEKKGNFFVVNPPINGLISKWVNNGDETSTLYICKPTGLRVIFR